MVFLATFPYQVVCSISRSIFNISKTVEYYSIFHHIHTVFISVSDLEQSIFLHGRSMFEKILCFWNFLVFQGYFHVFASFSYEQIIRPHSLFIVLKYFITQEKCFPGYKKLPLDFVQGELTSLDD